MSIKFNLRSGSCGSQSGCVSTDGCPAGICPDFLIRRHDTRPPFRVEVEDCNGPMDLQGLVVEVNMWALAKLKLAIADDDDFIELADNVGFNQIMVGDVIVMDRVRLPERMVVTAFDETNKLVKVDRGQDGTTASAWKKGTTMRIFRIMNAVASVDMSFEDIENIDGTTEQDVLSSTSLVYTWAPEDTCLPGCYWLEFKIIKMIDSVWYLPGGHWTGETHTDSDGFFFTGTSNTDSSVQLSFDQIQNYYLIPSILWAGEVHQHSDENYYTGTSHNDGSVLLNNTGVPVEETVGYNEDGLVSLDPGITPEFTDESLTPSDFGCTLGEGVEWVRRFPLNGEGFLIKIVDSPTREL